VTASPVLLTLGRLAQRLRLEGRLCPWRCVGACPRHAPSAVRPSQRGAGLCGTPARSVDPEDAARLESPALLPRGLPSAQRLLQRVDSL